MAGIGVRLQFTGDIATNGELCDPRLFSRLAASLADLSSRLGPCDLRVVNWESPLWGRGHFSGTKSLHLCTTREAALSVLPLGVHLACLANNHAGDCLASGFSATLSFLEENGIPFLGAGSTQEQAARPFLFDSGGKRIALTNYVSYDTNPHLDDSSGVFVNYLERDRALEETGVLSKTIDALCVCLHWGTEFVEYPSPDQRSFARRLVEEGAAVVIGHHSHCLQGTERWKNGVIFYGLGNFVFGGLQGREYRPWPARSRQGAVADCLLLDDGTVAATLVPTIQDGGLVRLDDSPERRREQDHRDSALALGCEAYQKLYSRKALYNSLVRSPARFFSTRGVMGAVRSLRTEHVSRFLSSLKEK